MITQKEFDDQALVELEIEECINQQADAVPPEIEIDSVPDYFGQLYRVWYGSQLLGTFYKNLKGKWIAQSCNIERFCCDTPYEAQRFIIAVNIFVVIHVV